MVHNKASNPSCLFWTLKLAKFLLFTSFWGLRGHAQLEGHPEVDTELTGRITYLIWHGNALGEAGKHCWAEGHLEYSALPAVTPLHSKWGQYHPFTTFNLALLSFLFINPHLEQLWVLSPQSKKVPGFDSHLENGFCLLSFHVLIVSLASFHGPKTWLGLTGNCSEVWM